MLTKGVCSIFVSRKLLLMETKDKILVVDDEETLCEVLRFNLEIEGYNVDVAHSAEEALKLKLTDYSLILLDVMMGEISGFKFAQMLKSNEATANIPIIFCTAKDHEDDMIAGLNLGADDYIFKPYSIRNITARVRSVLRRNARDTSKNDSDFLTYEGIVVDRRSKRCTIHGQEVKLPRKEYEILQLLLGNPDIVFSRSEILAKIWPDEVVVLERVVDVNITRLRSKIGEYGRHIITRAGYGYGFKL